MDELRLILQRCVYLAGLEKEYQSNQTPRDSSSFEGMIAGSPEMEQVFRMIEKVAASDAPVLILGESGTGKEMAANAVHQKSLRREKPFVAINCSAIPETLVESELFGHEKGAFTGADRQQKGRIESASGGTLFLDEIGDLPAPTQVKLLRFLQDKRLQRVGGREELEIDTRIVAATNANLEDAIEKGSFREDLYFRLAVVVLNLPPLRERSSDVVTLAQEFLKKYGEDNGKERLSFTPDTLNAISEYGWPGNVRQLENRIQRAVIMAEGNRVTLADMELTAFVHSEVPLKLKEARVSLEREMLEKALKKHSGKITAAAKELGVSRPTIYELMDKLGIEK